MNKVYIKKVSELTDIEIKKINQASQREFHEPFRQTPDVKSRLIFLLKDTQGQILSMGQLITVEPVTFMGQTFSFLGIGGIVSNIKAKGYGKKIMVGIKKYLKENQQIGVGFCGNQNRLFYEKCGFNVDPNLTKRFVCYENKKKIINPNNEAVVYFDENNYLVKKVLANLQEEVLLPRPPDW